MVRRGRPHPRRKPLLLALSLLVLAAVAAGCGSSGGSSSGSGGKTREVRILVSAPLSGDYAESGQELVAGAKLAASQLNAAGGIAAGPMRGAKLQIEAADDGLSTEGATTIASRFVQDNSIWSLMGFLSSAQAQAAGVVAQRGGLGVVSTMSCADFLTSQAHNIAVMCATLGDLGRVGTNFAGAVLRAKRFGTIAGDFSFNDSYYAGISDMARQLGMTWATRQTYPATGTTDFSALIENLKRANVDVVLSGAYQGDAGQILAQMRRAGLNVPFVDYLGEGWGKTFLGTAGPAATSGAYALYAGNIAPAAGSLEAGVMKAYQAQYGKPMSGSALHAYDSVKTIAAAIAAGAKNRQDLLKYIAQARGQGVLGPIAFTSALRPQERLASMIKITGTQPGDVRLAQLYRMTPGGVSAISASK